MLYVGGFSGRGTLRHEGKEVARAAYDFERFYEKKTGVVSGGELKTSAEALKSVFQATGLQLATDDGQLLSLKFSGKKLSEAVDVAHVDVIKELRPASGLRPYTPEVGKRLERSGA